MRKTRWCLQGDMHVWNSTDADQKRRSLEMADTIMIYVLQIRQLSISWQEFIVLGLPCGSAVLILD